MIDLHTHVLPGIDDGPPTLEGSLELARVAAAGGTTTIVATPHVAWEYPTTSGAVRDGVAALQAELDAAGIPIQLRTGAEVAISRGSETDDDELRQLRLGGGEWLLAECPLSGSSVGFDGLLHGLMLRGHRIVLAHPERSPAIQRNPDLLEQLVRSGMLSSITAGSLRGDFGGTVRRFTIELLEQDLVHNIASDAHDARRRRPGMDGVLEAAEEELPGIGERFAWMTVDVPRAILDGGPIPRAPGEPPQRRRKLGLFRRGGRTR